MRTSRLQRLAKACRLSLTLLCSLLFLALTPRVASAATLSGRITGPDGRAVPDANVMVRSSIATVAKRLTDANGLFTVTDLRAGRYDVVVTANGLSADPTAVTLGTDDVRELTIALRVSALTDSIVVSAEQVDVPLSRTADTVTVITAAQLRDEQVETVADALRFVPGMTVARSGGRGAVTSLFPRGGGSNYTLVLIDGVRVNSFGGGYDFGHLTVADIDHIEIVQGPQSALYGSDATGGVIQIITRRGGPLHADGLIEGGSQSTAREAFNAAGSLRSWTWGTGVEGARSDGFTGIAPADGERVSNDDDHLWRLSGALGWQAPSGADFLVTGRASRDERGSPGPFGSNPIGAFSGVDTVSRGINHNRQVGSHFNHPWSPRLYERIEANYMYLGSDFASPFGPSTSGTRRVDARVQEDLSINPMLSGSAGVEFLKERGTSSFITDTTGLSIPVERSMTGLFGELRFVGNDRFSVTGGARLEHLTRDSLAGNGSTRPTFPDQTIDSFNPKISLSYLAPTATRVHASAGTGIRPPDAFEISFTNNPNLKPERNRSFEAGVEQHLLKDAVLVNATLFYNSYDDLLVTVGTGLSGASRYQTDNISNARARGLELSGNFRVAPPVLIRANYTFLSTETLSVDGLNGIAPPPFKVGDPLIRRPRHLGTVNVTYTRRELTAFGEVTSRSETLDVEPNFGTFGGLFFDAGYTVINMGASVHVAPRLDVYGRITNVGDRAYEEVLGYPALGRAGIVGIRVATSR